MRRRLSSLFLFAMAAFAAPPSTARADKPTPYKGRFDFTTLDMQPVSDTVLLVPGSLVGNETHLGRFTGKVEYLYLDFGSFQSGYSNNQLNITLVNTFNSRVTDNILRLGLNYKFDCDDWVAVSEPGGIPFK